MCARQCPQGQAAGFKGKAVQVKKPASLTCALWPRGILGLLYQVPRSTLSREAGNPDLIRNFPMSKSWQCITLKKKKTYLRQTFFFFVYGLDPAISSQFMTPSVATLSCKVEGQNRSELTCAHHCPFQDLASGWGLPVCVLVLYLTHPVSYPVSVSPLYFWRLKLLGFSKFSF